VWQTHYSKQPRHLSFTSTDRLFWFRGEAVLSSGPVKVAVQKPTPLATRTQQRQARESLEHQLLQSDTQSQLVCSLHAPFWWHASCRNAAFSVQFVIILHRRGATCRDTPDGPMSLDLPPDNDRLLGQRNDSSREVKGVLGVSHFSSKWKLVFYKIACILQAQGSHSLYSFHPPQQSKASAHQSPRQQQVVTRHQSPAHHSIRSNDSLTF
jgi:hypothetical protein